MNERSQATMEEIEAEIMAVEEADEEGRQADAGFDGGEFSGPAHDRSLQDEIDKILEKHGVTRQEYEIWAWGNAPEHDDLAIAEDMGLEMSEE